VDVESAIDCGVVNVPGSGLKLGAITISATTLEGLLSTTVGIGVLLVEVVRQADIPNKLINPIILIQAFLFIILSQSVNRIIPYSSNRISGENGVIFYSAV
jgi:hypothetical protein